MSEFVERPVVFGQTLIGVLTMPAESAIPDRPTVVFLNSGIIHHVGPNRLYVGLARALASAGTASLRFDLPGIGDSTVPPRRATATIPELVDESIDAALGYLESQGHRNGFVALGLCSGADNAFRSATRDRRVVGTVMLDPNTYRTFGYYLHQGKRLLRREAWLNIVTGRHPYIQNILGRVMRKPREPGQEWPFLAPTTLPPRRMMRHQFKQLVERQVQLCCVFTAGLPGRYNHEKQFPRTYPGLDFKGCLHYEYWPDSDHTLSRESLRVRLASTLVSWMAEAPFPSPARRTAIEARATTSSPTL